VSASRPPARSPEHELSPADEVEELGDEAIIAQQTAAHALQPRANVSEESRSVVITEHPEPREPPRKSSAEATLVIRDRRALDEMRQKILRRQQEKQAHGRRALYLWGVLGLAAFVLGGIVAFLATDSHSESQAIDERAHAPAGQPTATGSGSLGTPRSVSVESPRKQ
jgi:hypothetical protein